MTKKKLFGAMARREGVSKQEFQDHYRHPHGTMGAHISTLRDYVQSHQLNSDLLGPAQTRFEAVAELWFDNDRDILDFRSEPMMTAYLNEDEWRFVDMKKTKLFIGQEEVLTSHPKAGRSEERADSEWRLTNRPTSIKLIQFIESGAGAKWRDDADEAMGERLGVFRHVCSHPTELVSIAPGRRPDFIGVREMWWPTLTAFQRGTAKDTEAWHWFNAREGTHTMLAQAERWR